MIIRAINNNKIGAYIILLLFIFSSWLGSLFTSVSIESISVDNPMPLWRWFESQITLSGTSSAVIALLFSVVTALSVSRFVSNHSLLNKQTALPAFTFVLCIACFPTSQYFTPSWIVAILFLVSSSLIYESHNLSKPANNCFLASLWMSVGSLFYYKAMLIFPLLIIIMITVRVLTFKSLLASITGLVVPWIFYLSYLLLIDADYTVLFNDLSLNISHFISSDHPSPVNRVTLSVLSVFVLLSFASISSHYNTKKIFIRVLYKVLIISTLYIIALTSITGYSFESTPIIAVPISIIFAHLLDNTKSKLWQNIFLIILLSLAIASQIIR